MRSGIDRLQRPTTESPDQTRLTPVLAAAPDDAVLRVATTAGAAPAVAEVLRESAPLVAGILDATSVGSGNSLIWARLESVDRLVGEILCDTLGEHEAADSRFTLEAAGLQFRVEPGVPTQPWRRRWRFEIDGVQNLLPLLAGWLAAMDDGVPVRPE